MELVFTVVDLKGNEYKSEPIGGWTDWKDTVKGAIVHAHEVALKHGPVKIKSIERVDIHRHVCECGETPLVMACHNCGKPLCYDCAKNSRNNKPICKDCKEKEIPYGS